MNKILLGTLLLFSSAIFAQSWMPLANAVVGRHHPISFSLDGKGYAVTGTLSNGQNTDDAYEYDPITDAWTALSKFPGTARSFGIGTTANGLAYLGFGATSSQYLNDLWSFNAATGVWTQLADCDCSGRRHPAMISIGNTIYVGLGDDASGDRNDWWMYDITSDSWAQIANLPGPPRHHPFMFNAGGEIFAGMGHSGGVIYNDWYTLNTTTNTWSAKNDFPGEARVAGQQFTLNGYGFVISGDGDNHDYMETGEMWRYRPATDEWLQLPSHPGESRWAPGSFVINEEVYFFGGRNRLTNVFPNDLWKFDLAAATVGIKEEALVETEVYPNPANGVLYWKSELNITEVRIYNTLGQLVLLSNTQMPELNTQELKMGVYMVQFYTNATLVNTSKVLIQH
ncbi:MAG: N-acetylneuraminic acid mutarotase [Salibacteraceae bacterium]|jgi:N-acetylneuraminic acid mutarotase